MLRIDRRETVHFEAKLARGGLPRSIWETYSAFANTDGGTIALGVKELPDKTLDIAGVEDPSRLIRDFWNTVNDRSKVNLNIMTDRNVSIERDGNKKVVLIHVPRAERFARPIYLNRDLNGGVFRRNGEGDYRCSAEEIRAMLRDAEGKSQDLNLVEWATPDALDIDSVRRYRNRMQSCRPGHVWLGLDDQTFLLRLGAMGYDRDGVMRPTRAGILMFGNEYNIVREFPAYFLDYQERFAVGVRWTDRLCSTSGEWTGNVFDFYFNTYNRIAQTLKTPFQMKRGERIDDTPVHNAIREALANCLVNADYYQPRGVVVVRDLETLFISNPGGFRVPIATALSGGVSDPRNATILKMFNLIDIGERTGSGIPSIRDTWQQMKWPEISVIEECNPERTTIRLLLPSARRQESVVGQQEMQQETRQETHDKNLMRERILVILSDGEKSRREISMALGQKKITGRLNQCIIQLLASGEIEKSMPDKPQSRFQKYRKTCKG